MKTTYSLDDITLIPRNLSTVRSRNDIDLSIKLNNTRIRMPILPAPMDTVAGHEMCISFYNNGMLGMLHRFKSAEERVEIYRALIDKKMDAIMAIGLDEENLVKELYDLGARHFVIDVANGFNNTIESMVTFLKDLKDTFIISGNVASGEGFRYLSELGVHAIRVGIGTGSMCTTSIMTGVGQGIVSALEECIAVRDELPYKPLIIADGGIHSVGSMAKALALGADLVMMGKLFAGTKEAEGNILKFNQALYKAYRGSASYAVQKIRGKNPYYVEGDETIVEYKGSVQNIFDSIEAGLKSAISYMGARDIMEFRDNASFGVYHNNSHITSNR